MVKYKDTSRALLGVYEAELADTLTIDTKIENMQIQTLPFNNRNR